MSKGILPYDDPYAFLAFHLIAHLSKAELKRALKDDDFVFHMLVKEVRGQDFRGPFVDAIITVLLEDKRRMSLMNELDKLAKYLWTELDLERLRKKIFEEATKYSMI